MAEFDVTIINGKIPSLSPKELAQCLGCLLTEVRTEHKIVINGTMKPFEERSVIDVEGTTANDCVSDLVNFIKSIGGYDD